MDKLVFTVGKILLSTIIIVVILGMVFNFIAVITLEDRLSNEVSPLITSISMNNYIIPEIALLYTGSKSGKFIPNSKEASSSVFSSFINEYVTNVQIQNVQDLIIRKGRNVGDIVDLVIVVDMRLVIWTPVGPQIKNTQREYSYKVPCLRYYKD